MRRKLLWPVLALVLLLAACAGTPNDSQPLYAVGDAQRLVDAGAFSGQMEEVDSYIVALLYGIDEDTIKECAGYMAINTSVSADEVTVLILTDNDAARAAEEACRKRADSQIESYQTYCPDQVPRLEDAVILRRGNTVLFAVGDPDELPRALKDLALDS